MAGKNKSNRENLLRYLNKEITFEEWEQISGAAVNSENEASDATGAESSLVQEVAAEMSVDTVTMDLSELQHAMPPLITTQVSGGSGEGAEPEDRDAGGPVYIDTEMTVKYLQGEITFEEYSTLLQKQAALDDDEDEEVEDFTAVANVEEVETQSDEAPKEKPVRLKSFRKKKHLNAFQAGLMGEANMQFARGEINEAIRMCFEVVRQVPRAPEPYQTLALIYEEQGDMAKALQFSLIGAHMSPRDVDEWVRVAEMSLDQQQPNQAITCYSYAIKADPKNASLVLARCNLFDRLGETKKALEGYRHVLDILEPGHETQFISISRDVAGRAHATDDLPMAIDAMYQAFIKCPHHVSAEDESGELVDRVFEKIKEDKSMTGTSTHLALDYFDSMKILGEMDMLGELVEAAKEQAGLVSLGPYATFDNLSKLQGKLSTEWDRYRSGDHTAMKLLKACAHLYGPVE